MENLSNKKNKMNDRATDYAKRVVSGDVVCGELHFLACKRHLDDLARQNTEDFPYYWDVEAGERVLDFAETLILSEGVESKPLKLMDCQAFDISVTFGWKKTSNGRRRFRRRYKSISRQQGKSMENGLMGTYISGFSGYKHGKLFTVATKRRQAKIAFDEMVKFIHADKDLNELFSIKEYKSTIEAIETGCTVEALSREGGLDDGFRSIFASVDEVHQHKDNKIYKALYNGTRSLDETLISMITTRGDNLNSFCKEMDDYCINILRGSATAEDFFVDIYCLDPDDDIWEEKNWVKACPFTCADAERLSTLRRDAQTAKDMGGSDLRDFLTKSLNMWVQNTDDQFILADKWQKCGSKRTLEDMRGRSCWVGLDLSSGGDLTSYSLEFPLEENSKEKYYFYSHSFMPRGRLQEHIETDLAPYDLWEQMELITVTGGAGDFKNDYKFIIKDLERIKEEYNLTFLGIGIDPHNADGVLSELEEFGCPVVIIVQSCKSLNDATTDIQLLVKSEDLEYNENNELLTWSFLNAKTVRNSFDEIKVDKKPGARFKRIDPVDSCVDAHACMLKNKTKEVVDVNSELDNYLKAMGWKKD